MQYLCHHSSLAIDIAHWQVVGYPKLTEQVIIGVVKVSRR
jgi:hypothetical protein